jgi:hypothetical protein
MTAWSAVRWLNGWRLDLVDGRRELVCAGETLANELAARIPVFFFSPGLVRTELTAGGLPDDAP